MYFNSNIEKKTMLNNNYTQVPTVLNFNHNSINNYKNVHIKLIYYVFFENITIVINTTNTK